MKTVFILGAGSTCMYGMPTTSQLLEFICNMTLNENFEGANSQVNYNQPEGVFNHLLKVKFNPELIKEFHNALMAQKPVSIDKFLSRRNNHRFIALGKCCITAAISHKESEDFYLKCSEIENWYQLLGDYLLDNLTLFEKGEISFITFNYDRTLETFLKSYLLASNYNIIDEEILDKKISEAVSHVYGVPHIISYGYYSKVNIFDGKITINDKEGANLNRASEGIRLIDSHRNDIELITPIVEKIMSAEYIYFLGFGFDTINIERIKLREALRHKRRFTYGSAQGFEIIKLENLEEYLWGPSNIDNKRLRFIEMNCKKFFHNYINTFIKPQKPRPAKVLFNE